eukprot:403363766
MESLNQKDLDSNDVVQIDTSTQAFNQSTNHSDQHSSYSNHSSNKAFDSKELNANDLLVRQIITDDVDLEENINAFDLINHFQRYESSLKKFNISAEELFEKLSIKNKNMDNFTFLKKDQLLLSQQKRQDEEFKSYEYDFNGNRVNLFLELPQELISHIFTYLGLKCFLSTPMVCKEWNEIFKKKSTGQIFKKHCLNLWNKNLYSATAKFLAKFSNWRHMIRMRPFLRYDGFYVCKMMYIRQGLSETSMNNPVHQVISYKYIRFYQDGSCVSLYTNSNPKKFLPKIKQQLQTLNKSGTQQENQHHPEYQLYTQADSHISINTGNYKIQNDYLTIIQLIGATEYRYEFQMIRNEALPEYQKDCDHLDMWWAGFKIDEEQIVDSGDDNRNYIQIKINNHYDNKFNFREVPDLA